MNRTVFTFPCAGETLAGTLDAAPGRTALLIVSGGNEIRIGACRGMAALAARVAAAGYPVLRFDRRGIGDSTGENNGFGGSADDIAAAVAALRERAAQVERIVAFGNCDAATALALHGAAAGIDALILANPWVIEPTDDLPPPAAIKRHYAARIVDPAAWRALVTGRLNLIAAFRGLKRIAVPEAPAADDLAARFVRGWARQALPTTLVLATGDATAIAFEDAAKREAFAEWRAAVPVQRIDTKSHSFAGAADADALYAVIINALTGAAPTG